MKWLLPAAIAAGVVALIIFRRRGPPAAPTLYSSVDLYPSSSHGPEAPSAPAAESRIARINREERALWDQAQALMDEKNRIAREHAPGWQVRVGAIVDRIADIAQRRGRLSYERSQVQQGRL